MPAFTPNYTFALPTVGAEAVAWASFLNSNWSSLDGILATQAGDISTQAGQISTINANYTALLDDIAFMNARLDGHDSDFVNVFANWAFTDGDAPSNGSEYVRKDGAWAVATGGGGGISDAPNDGNDYWRNSLGWVVGNWSNLDGKPSTFPPSAHTHFVSDIIFLPGFTLVGRPSSGTGAASDISLGVGLAFNTGALEVDATALPVFTSTDAGVVPASGGGTTNFLRADGVFAAPPGGGISDAPNDGNDYWRNSLGWVIGNWTNLDGKPSTFPPSAHTHPITDLDTIAALTVLGNAGPAPNGVEEISAGSNGQVLQTVSNTVAWGALPLTAVATQAANTLVANATGGAAAPTAVGLASSLQFSGGVLDVVDSVITPAWGNLTGVPTEFPPEAHTHFPSDLFFTALSLAGRPTTGSGAGSNVGLTSPLGFSGGNVFLDQSGLTPPWAGITGKPTTLAGYGITDAQPLDADLTALAALAGTGIARRTAADTWSVGTPVALTEMATQAANTVLANATSSAATPTAVALAASQLLGRGSTGDIAAITLGTNLSMSGGTLNASGGGGVTDAEYIVGAAHAGLSAERVLTNSAQISFDLSTPGQVSADIDNVPLNRVEDIPDWSILGNSSGAAASPAPITSGGAGEVLYNDGNDVLFVTLHANLLDYFALEPAQITATQNDYEPASFSLCTSLRLSSDASRTITSMAPRLDGMPLHIENIGSFDIVFQHNSGGTVENRFLLPGGADFTLGPNCGATFIYDDNGDTTSRWRLLRSVDATGGGGSPVVISPASFGTDQTDYNPTSFSTCTYMRLTTSAAVSIFSLATRTSGTVITVANVGTFAITLVDEYTTGTTAAQRFALDGNTVIAPESAIDLVYDGTTARWRVLSPPSRTVNDLTELTTPDPDADFVPIWDASAAGTFKVKPRTLRGLVTVSPSQITANQDDYSPTDIDKADVLRIDTDNARYITGITGGVAGRRLAVHVLDTAQGPLILHNDVTSTAANRFKLNRRRLFVWPGETVELWYDGTASRWKILQESVGVVGDDFIDIFEDFFSGVQGTGTATEAGESVGSWNWRSTANGTAASTSPASVAGHPGIIQLVTGATSGNDTRLHLGNSATEDIIRFQDVRYAAFLVRTTDITTNRMKAGLGVDLGDGTLAAFGSDGVFFEFDSATNSGQWRTHTRAASTTTSNNTAVAVVNNEWDMLEMFRLANGNWAFFINEALQFTHSANLPTTAMANIGVFVETQTAAARNMQIDWLRLRTASLGQRYT